MLLLTDECQGGKRRRNMHGIFGTAIPSTRRPDHAHFNLFQVALWPGCWMTGGWHGGWMRFCRTIKPSPHSGSKTWRWRDKKNDVTTCKQTVEVNIWVKITKNWNKHISADLLSHLQRGLRGTVRWNLKSGINHTHSLSEDAGRGPCLFSLALTQWPSVPLCAHQQLNQSSKSSSSSFESTS